MSYLSSNDARRQNSTAEVDGFSTPAEELFLCTCHGKRWPLSMLKIENGGQRHCPNQANAQGGSIDRDMLRDYDRVELERRAVDDAAAVQWPITPLETIAVVASIEPPSQSVPMGGVSVSFVIRGANLSVVDEWSLGVLDVLDPPWPPDGLPLAVPSIVFAGDGLSATVTWVTPLQSYPDPLLFPLLVYTPRSNWSLTYNGVVYENVFLLR